MSRTMEDSGKQHTQERALRAVEMASISGFLDDIRKLQESCLLLCNSCCEYVPLRYLRIGLGVPSTLLAVFWPDLLCAEAPGASRVLLPRKVLKVDWRFGDRYTNTSFVWEEKEEEEEEGEEQEEEKEDKVERGAVTACDIDMSKVRWPEGVKEIYLWGFNRRIDEVVWPVFLELLSFHLPRAEIGRLPFIYGTMDRFNSPLDGVTFPAGLRELFLGENFNQCIDHVAWPEGLERLSMPGFNQPIDDVQWPPGLKTLEFTEPYECERWRSREEMSSPQIDGTFDKPLGSFLPMSLESLRLSDHFDQSLSDVIWPSGLAVLKLGRWVSTDAIGEAAWPPGLRTLVVMDGYHVVEDAPPGCTVVYVELREFSPL